MTMNKQTKPTPEEKCDWCGYLGMVKQGEQCQKCRKPSPSPEAKRECYDPDMKTWGKHKYDKDGFCIFCGNTSPEARVDWEEEAREIVEGNAIKNFGSSWFINREGMNCCIADFAKALSAAFEKGREAR